MHFVNGIFTFVQNGENNLPVFLAFRLHPGKEKDGRQRHHRSPGSLKAGKGNFEGLIGQSPSEAVRKRLDGRHNDGPPERTKWLFTAISGILSIKEGG